MMRLPEKLDRGGFLYTGIPRFKPKKNPERGSTD
jgi:hypothetical protein